MLKITVESWGRPISNTTDPESLEMSVTTELHGTVRLPKVMRTFMSQVEMAGYGFDPEDKKRWSGADE